MANVDRDVTLLKAVIFCGVHLAKLGESQTRFEEVLQRLLEQLLGGQWVITAKPTWNFLNDQFKKIVADHRESRRKNEEESVIVDIRGYREGLLDGIVLAIV